MKMSVPSSKVVDPSNINHAYIHINLILRLTQTKSRKRQIAGWGASDFGRRKTEFSFELCLKEFQKTLQLGVLSCTDHQHATKAKDIYIMYFS